MTPLRLVGMLLLVAGMVGEAGVQHGHGTAPAPSQGQRGFAVEMHMAMEKMARDMAAAPMTGDPDQDFLATMIPHHEGAVEMARLVLLHGRDPLVRRLAEEIIAGQQVEIAAMQERLAILRAGGDRNPGGFPALGGTRGPAGPGGPHSR